MHPPECVVLQNNQQDKEDIALGVRPRGILNGQVARNCKTGSSYIIVSKMDCEAWLSATNDRVDGQKVHRECLVQCFVQCTMQKRFLLP